MPFDTWTFYYRDEATRQSEVPDPEDLPAAQVVECNADFNDGGMAVVRSQKQGTNNISTDPALRADLKKILTTQEQGTLGEKWNIQLNVSRDDPRLAKLEGFFNAPQLEEAHHRFGMIGVSAPLGTWTLDPSTQNGLAIYDLTTIWTTQTLSYSVSEIILLKLGDLAQGTVDET